MNSRQYVTFYHDGIESMTGKGAIMAVAISDRLGPLLSKIAVGRGSTTGRELDVNADILYVPQFFVAAGRRLVVSTCQMTYAGIVKPYSYYYAIANPFSVEITESIHSHFRGLRKNYTEEWVFENGDRCWVFENPAYHESMIDSYAVHKREQIKLVK